MANTPIAAVAWEHVGCFAILASGRSRLWVWPRSWLRESLRFDGDWVRAEVYLFVYGNRRSPVYLKFGVIADRMAGSSLRVDRITS